MTNKALKTALFLAAIIFLSFSPCLSNPFVYWDDDSHIIENPLVTDPPENSLVEIFTTVVNKTYIPLTVLSFQIEHRLFGLNPVFFHLDNILLHFLVCWFLYRLVTRMGLGEPTAVYSALLFAVHPMHVESVAWATARKDVLYSVFYLLAMNSYWMYLERRGTAGRVPIPYWTALLFALLAILAKPMALSLPLILVLLEWYKNRSVGISTFKQLVPFFTVIVPVAWLTYQLNSRVPHFDWETSPLLWVWTATFYIKKFLTPFVLLPLYQVPEPISLSNPTYLSGFIVVLVIALLIIRLRDRLFLFACGFYVLSTFFLWRFDGAVDVTIVADRFMYLPSLGFCVWIAHTLMKRPAFHWIAAVLIGLCLIQTHRQCRVWRDDLTLWDHVINHKQEVFLAYNSRAVALLKASKMVKGNDIMALWNFNHALKLNPNYGRGFFNRGKLYEDWREFDAAIEDFDRALSLNPQEAKYLIERGIVRSKRQEYQKAVEDFNAALAIDPGDSGTYNNRGIAFKGLGKTTEAIADYNKAIELNPQSVQAYVNRANLWIELNRASDALSDLNRAREMGFPVDSRLLKSLSNP